MSEDPVPKLGIREALMLLYALVWAVLMVAYGLRSDDFPPPEMWTYLGVGEGALLALFAGDEAARRRGRNGNGNGNGQYENGKANH